MKIKNRFVIIESNREIEEEHVADVIEGYMVPRVRRIKVIRIP
jgi:hypothetical protein